MPTTDIRQTIEWVFKVRDEVTPSVEAIRRTAQDAIADMDGLVSVQDSAASSSEALRASVTRTRAETATAASDVARLDSEAQRTIDGLTKRRADVQAEMAALRSIVDEDLAVPEPDLTAVRRAVEEAERIAGIRIVLPAPDTSELEAVMDEIGRLLEEPASVPAPDLSALEASAEEAERIRESAAVSARRAREEMEAALAVSVPEIPAPDASAVESAMDEARRMVAEPLAVPAPDTSGAEGAMDALRARAEEYRIAIEATLAQMEAEVDECDEGIRAQTARARASATADHAAIRSGAEATASASSAAMGQVASSQAQARAEIAMTDDAMARQRVSMTDQLVAIGSLKEGVSGIIGGITSLGIVSDETAQTLGKVNAAFSIMAGAAQTLKALQGAMAALNVATAVNASLNSFNAVIQNPAMMAGVGLAAGAAMGVAGAFLLTQNSSQTTTNITIVDGSEGRAETGAEIYDIVTGGAL